MSKKLKKFEAEICNFEILPSTVQNRCLKSEN